MSDANTEREATGSVPPGRPLGEGSKPEEQPDLGPTGPASVEGEKQSPDLSKDNAKGGYGAG